LTEFSRRKFIEAGLPAHKIFMKPNFLNGDTLRPTKKGGYAIYMGRLSPNKGVRAMLAAWRDLPAIPLKIVGEGELRAELEGVARDNGLEHVTFLGYQPWEACMELLGGAAFLVLPSEHHEGFPCVIAEAYGLGKPVLASRQDPLPELVRDGETGLLFDTGCPEDLAEKARLMFQDADRIDRLGSAAREEYEAKYTPERNHRALMQIYEAAIAARKRRSES
jgi:glycosyltransferase involved in cell wall biosynthesis